jgi:hypothetical protein
MSETEKRVTRADLESGLRAVRGQVDEVVESKRRTLVLVGSAVGVLVVLVAWALGKRSGRRGRGVIEIRR